MVTVTPARHNLRYHIGMSLLGFLSISLEGYVLSHTTTTITDQFGISDVLFGVIILALAITLPEKFIAILRSCRGHAGILVTNTVGSNIFLLSLCTGIIIVQTEGNFNNVSIKITELCILQPRYGSMADGASVIGGMAIDAILLTEGA
ncbi:hypothetical protein F5884DRAFT_2605 [Xylogone sp. PMI_703]|nr:hypothetical protein F5884DRAFT_2605 [Xylogone sp. PMI_703]